MLRWASHYLGDILDYDGRVDVIAHQVNCQGVMGGGLALQIKNKWPEVYKAYTDFIDDTIQQKGELGRRYLLGQCGLIRTSHCFVANLFGQYDIGGGQRTDYEALLKSLKSLRSQMDDRGLRSAAFPLGIGCGLAGGRWEVVSTLIEDVFEGSDISVTFVEYSPQD